MDIWLCHVNTTNRTYLARNLEVRTCDTMVLRSEFAVKTCKGNKCVQFITLKYIHSITTLKEKHSFLKSDLTVNCIGKIIDTNP